MKQTTQIKGSCEHCGFAYTGTVSLKDGAFAEIKCPNCHQVTHNFDEAVVVAELDKKEGNALDYKQSVIEMV
jgi:hypothetical protein